MRAWCYILADNLRPFSQRIRHDIKYYRENKTQEKMMRRWLADSDWSKIYGPIISAKFHRDQLKQYFINVKPNSSFNVKQNVRFGQ